MELKLQRRLMELKPELTVNQLKEQSEEILEYWIDACLEDVLEASTT